MLLNDRTTLAGVVSSPSITRRFNADGLLYVPAGSVLGALAPAPLYVPPGSAIGADAPGGRYVPAGETIFAAAEVAPDTGMKASRAASIGPPTPAALYLLAESVVGALAPARQAPEGSTISVAEE